MTEPVSGPGRSTPLGAERNPARTTALGAEDRCIIKHSRGG